MAVITPYAQFMFRFISDASEYDFCFVLFLFSLNLFFSFIYVHALTCIVVLVCAFDAFKFLCSKNVTIRFSRRTDVMPPVPAETKHHPSSVDLLLIKRLINETSKQNLLQFLQHEFVNIGKSLAERLIGIICNLSCLAGTGSAQYYMSL